MAEFVEKFPLKPSPEQEATLLGWLETCRKVWNLGLNLLLELDDCTSLAKTTTEAGKKRWIAVPSSKFAVRGEGPNQPVPTSWHKNDFKNGDGEVVETVWGEMCYILAKSRIGGAVDRWTGQTFHDFQPELIRVGQCCPLPIPEWQEPRLGLQIPGKFTLQYYFTQANIKERHPYLAEDFSNVPVWFVRGVCGSLWQAWSKYKSGSGGIPRFKRLSDPLSSFTYADAAKLTLAAVDSKNGTIAIPKLDRNTKGKQVPGVLHVVDLVKRFSISGELYQPSVARIIRTSSGGWQLHLTSYKPSEGDIYNLLRLLACKGFNSPLAQFELLTASPWMLKRNQDCVLVVPGEDYVVAVDDRGYGYSVLPRRHTDGALDPHNLIAKLDRQIEELQQQISWKMECAKKYGTPAHSNRLAELKRRKRKLEARRAAILRSSRQKIAHFISERSRIVKVIHKPTQRIRKPKRKLEEGSMPVQFKPNGAGRVAEINKKTANAAPGEFIALLERYASDRGQKIVVKKEEKPKRNKRNKR